MLGGGGGGGDEAGFGFESVMGAGKQGAWVESDEHWLVSIGMVVSGITATSPMVT